MIAICINRSDNKYYKNHFFTIGEKYEYTTKENFWWIRNDKGRMIGFSDWQFKVSFKDLNKLREEKLIKLEIK